MNKGSKIQNQLRRGKSVHEKIHEFFLKELERKRKELLDDRKVKFS